MKFIKLKDDKFTYIDKTYTQERFINEDKNIFITQDCLDHTKVYTGNSEGLAVRIYLKDNESPGYPLYTIKQVIELLETYKGPLMPISINESHYKGKRDNRSKFQKSIERLRVKDN